MSDFISHMPCGRLDGDAAGVEGDALADQRDPLRRRSTPVRRVGQADQPRRWPPNPGPTARMPPYPPALQRLLVEDLDLEAGLGAAAATASANDGGRSSFGAVFTQSRVSRTARATTVGPARPRPRASASAASGTCSRDRGDRVPAARLRLRLVAGEPVGAQQRALGDGPQHGRARPRRRTAAGPARPWPLPASARTAAPAARRSVSGAGAAPVGSAPRPTATTSGAATVPSVASLVTSPGAPVAPSRARVDGQPAVEGGGDALRAAGQQQGAAPRSGWLCRPMTMASTASSAGSVSTRLRVVAGWVTRSLRDGWGRDASGRSGGVDRPARVTPGASGVPPMLTTVATCR